MAADVADHPEGTETFRQEPLETRSHLLGVGSQLAIEDLTDAGHAGRSRHGMPTVRVRWTAKHRAALIVNIMKGGTSAQAAARESRG